MTLSTSMYSHLPNSGEYSFMPFGISRSISAMLILFSIFFLRFFCVILHFVSLYHSFLRAYDS